MANKIVDGFDYKTSAKISLPMAECKQIQADILSKGGRRSTAWGETFLRDKLGTLVYEFYVVVPVSKSLSAQKTGAEHER